jgi:dimethylamine monooxygenase subunit C
MLITGIKSKPVYAPLEPDLSGRYHLMVGLGVGASPLLRVLAQLSAAAPEAGARTRLLYAPDATVSAELLAAVHIAPVGERAVYARGAQLLEALPGVLDASLMGARLYVAGPESFMGLVMRTAHEFNLNRDEVRAEECGTLARRVYCIHCNVVTEEVRTNIVSCRGCARSLLVRDHYSRRLAAYMGVMADAEVPGELPPIREVFP